MMNSRKVGDLRYILEDGGKYGFRGLLEMGGFLVLLCEGDGRKGFGCRGR